MLNEPYLNNLIVKIEFVCDTGIGFQFKAVSETRDLFTIARFTRDSLCDFFFKVVVMPRGPFTYRLALARLVTGHQIANTRSRNLATPGIPPFLTVLVHYDPLRFLLNAVTAD